jgi:uncharacterized protein YcfJ
MQKTISITTVAVLAALGASAQAQDLTGRVISSTPVVQQVQVPRTVCSNQPVAVQQPRSGAGAVIGAIAGAALGNAIGAGAGRAVATGVGLIGGAAVGDRIEGGGVAYQNGQQCSTQTFYENRTVGYNVTYEFGGRQYTMQMPNDPGPTVRLQVSPIGASAPQGTYGPTSEIVSVPGVVASTTTVYPAYQTYPAYPTYPAYQTYPPYPAYAAYPAYYPAYPYYSPVGISLGFGFGGGWGGHRHGGHWR